MTKKISSTKPCGRNSKKYNGAFLKCFSICKKVTTDCSLIVPIFVNGFDHNTKLQYIQSICFSFYMLLEAVYSNYKHVYFKGGRLKETSRYAIAKLESQLWY